MVETSRNIVKDGGKLTQPHGKLRKTNPISKCLSHIYSTKTENLSNIHNNSMRSEWCLQHDGRRFMWYLWWWQDAQPQNLWKLKWDLQQWQKIWMILTVMAEHFLSFFGPSNPNLVLQFCGYTCQSFSNHTNPFIFFAVNDYNNNYSSTPTQHTKTGEWHW